MALNKNESTLLLGGAVLAILYWGLIRPITNKLGLTQSEKDRREAEMVNEANKNPGWNPNFWKQPAPISHTIFTEKYVQDLAQKIYNAWGKFNDDEQAIFAVFRSLRSQAQLSQLCYYYSKKYNQDLLTRLKAPWYYANDGLDDIEFKVIAEIVLKLPTYLKVK